MLFALKVTSVFIATHVNLTLNVKASHHPCVSMNPHSSVCLVAESCCAVVCQQISYQHNSKLVTRKKKHAYGNNDGNSALWH